MSEKPILFNGEMVRAILDGRKTQTRRIAKEFNDSCVSCDNCGNVYVFVPETEDKDGFGEWTTPAYACPHWNIGDRLYVRENFRLLSSHDNQSPSSISPLSVVSYDADNAIGVPSGFGRLRPSIHMPRWASRITLKITDICVERLQDITDEDAISEGIERVNQCGILRCCGFKDYQRLCSGFIKPRPSFASLWNSINGADETKSWNANPWVWVVEFQRIKP